MIEQSLPNSRRKFFIFFKIAFFKSYSSYGSDKSRNSNIYISLRTPVISLLSIADGAFPLDKSNLS